jgi:hypothetical protein
VELCTYQGVAVSVRFTPQGCKVETTCIIQPNGTYTEKVVLSVDPASMLALEIEEHATVSLAERVATLPKRGSTRVRATRHGFELVPERS